MRNLKHLSSERGSQTDGEAEKQEHTHTKKTPKLTDLGSYKKGCVTSQLINLPSALLRK